MFVSISEMLDKTHLNFSACPCSLSAQSAVAVSQRISDMFFSPVYLASDTLLTSPPLLPLSHTYLPLACLDASTPVLSLNGQTNKPSLPAEKSLQPLLHLSIGRADLDWADPWHKAKSEWQPGLKKVKRLGGLADWSQGYMPIQLKEPKVE